jgi:hypothetical protein
MIIIYFQPLIIIITTLYLDLAMILHVNCIKLLKEKFDEILIDDPNLESFNID